MNDASFSFHTSLRALSDMLDEGMLDNPNMRIEYGARNEIPGGFHSYIRIRKMQTAGGVQYCVKTLSGGTESGGCYSPDKQGALYFAEMMLMGVHQPLKNIPPAIAAALEERKRENPLSWWAYDVTQKQPAPPIRGILNSRFTPKWMENASVTTLGEEPAAAGEFKKTHPRLSRLVAERVTIFGNKSLDLLERYRNLKNEALVGEDRLDREDDLEYYARRIRRAIAERHQPLKSNIVSS